MFNTFGRASNAIKLIEDFSEVCPEGLVASSQWPAHQDIHVMRFRHDRRELLVPPLANIVVMINLSSIANVTVRIKGQEFSRLLQEGESVIIPAGTASEWQCPGRKAYDMLHIYLSPALLRKAAADSNIDIARADVEPEFGIGDPHIQHIGLSLLAELEGTGEAARAYVDLLATALAVHLLRRHSFAAPRAQQLNGCMPKHKLRRALDYISDKLGEELKVAEIAEEVKVSEAHFTRLFRQATGLAPHQYIMQMRIEMAKRLLVETEFPIARIAFDIGFQSQSRFTTLFRQFTGTTPRAYRGQNASFTPPLQSLKGARLFYEADRNLSAA